MAVEYGLGCAVGTELVTGRVTVVVPATLEVWEAGTMRPMTGSTKETVVCWQ